VAGDTQMQTETDRILARLRTQFGRTWELWVVYQATARGVIWCARRHDDHQYVVNEDTAGALELRLASEEA
jgi:hypothetical protein